MSLDDIRSQLEIGRISKRIANRSYNPLAVKMGDIFSFPHERGIGDILLSLQAISRSERADEYWHIDYHLEGECPFSEQILDIRLRLYIDPKDSSVVRFMLFYVLDQKTWQESMREGLENEAGEYLVSHCEEQELIEPRKYWRIQEEIKSLKSSLNYFKSSGHFVVSVNYEMTYWDFCRETLDHNSSETTEYMMVEHNHHTDNVFILHGFEISLSQIHIANKNQFSFS